MPTTYKKKLASTRGNWSQENLLKAVEAINKKTISINKAAKIYNIPRSTLKRRMKINNFSIGRLGPHSMLGESVEKNLVFHIKRLQAHGFTPSRDFVRSMAYHLAEQLNIKHNFNKFKKKAGYDWLNSFLSRNPGLTIEKSERFAHDINEKAVLKYFESLKNILTETELVNEPGNIFKIIDNELLLENESEDTIAMEEIGNTKT